MSRLVAILTALTLQGCLTMPLQVVHGPDNGGMYQASCLGAGAPCMDEASKLCRMRGGYKLISQTTVVSGFFGVTGGAQFMFFNCNKGEPPEIADDLAMRPAQPPAEAPRK